MLEDNLTPHWYVVHTYSGYENKVAVNLEKIVENRKVGDLIHAIKIPMEKIPESEGGDGVAERKIFPSYVLVKMIMNDESWHVVRNITGVTGFVGPGSEPVPLTDEEVEMFKIEVRTEGPKFNIGDMIEVISGTFQGYKGKLQSIDEEKKQVVIIASMASRDIPIFVDIKDIRVAE